MEKDLFQPIKDFFTKQGYTCDGEVGDIDLYMEREGETAAVELKVSLDFRAVQQAALRQKLVDSVYIGIPTPKDFNSRAFKDKLYLLKRLGIGLVTVSERSGYVSVANEAVVSELITFRRRNTAKSEALSKEFGKRRVKNNTGGVHCTKLMTGYRENALLVLDALCELGGEATAKDVRIRSGVDKAATILRANYYKWFAHDRARGTYRLVEAGYAAFEEFEDAMKVLKRGQQPAE